MPEIAGKATGKAGETSPETGKLTGCLYETLGELCGKGVMARGYCRKHYKALLKAGAFKAQPTTLQPTITAGNLDRNLGHIERARLALTAHTETLVEILIEAARNAAKKGDSRPAEWALLHARAFEPVLTGGSPKAADSAQGVRVIIGVQLGQQGQLQGAMASPEGASTYVQPVLRTQSDQPINALPVPQPTILQPPHITTQSAPQIASSPDCLGQPAANPTRIIQGELVASSLPQ